MDIKSKKARSRNMSAIRGKDTKPELIIRSLLFSNGYRYRLYKKDLPGKPDMYLARYNTVIFIHGCFWHQHTNCKQAYTPKSNTDFWKDKLQKNVERDQSNILTLLESGIKVLIIWECTIKRIKTNQDRETMLTDIKNVLLSNSVILYEI